METLTLALLRQLLSKAQGWILFLKTLSCWYSLRSSCWVLSDENPGVKVSIIFRIFASFCTGQVSIVSQNQTNILRGTFEHERVKMKNKLKAQVHKRNAKTKYWDINQTFNFKAVQLRGLSMVLLQLKDPLELFVKRREFFPGSWFLSCHAMTLAVHSGVTTQSFLLQLLTSHNVNSIKANSYLFYKT